MLIADRTIGFFGRVLLSRVRHRFRPDVEPASHQRELQEGMTNFPHAPDAFALVVAVVHHRVAANITLDPVTDAGLDRVLPLDGELAHPVESRAGHHALGKRQQQFGLLLSFNRWLQPEPDPMTRRETIVEFQLWSRVVGGRVVRRHGHFAFRFIKSFKNARALSSSVKMPSN